MSRATRIALLSAVSSIGLVSAVQAGQFYTVAVEGQTTMPGFPGTTFGSFSNNPGISTDGNDVVFNGGNSVTGSDQGLYDYNIATGQLSAVALENGSNPDGYDFSDVGQASVNSGVVSFYGQTTSGTLGIFTAPTNGSSISQLATTNTPQPGSPVGSNFTSLGNYSAQSGSNIVVAGLSQPPSSPEWSGVYLSQNGGALTKVVDNSSSFTGSNGVFNSAAISGSTVVFSSLYNSNNEGIYSTTTSGSPVNVIALGDGTATTGASAAPGIGGYFTSFYGPFTDGNHVVFYGFNNQSNGQGGYQAGLFLYNTSGSGGQAIVTSSTVIPGSGGKTFDMPIVSTYAISNGIVAFNGEASDGSYDGIYAYQNGTIAPVIIAGDTIPTEPGYTVSYAGLVGFSQSIADGVDDYAFEAILTDNADPTNSADDLTGIFVDPVAVPEPCSLGLLGVGGLLILRRRRSALA